MLDTTKKLIEHENNEILKRKDIINSVINEVVNILIKNNFTLEEWTLVIDYFNRMSEIAITKMSIQELKKKNNE